jgi:hypothetical protein
MILLILTTAFGATYGPGTWNGPLVLADGDMLVGPLSGITDLIIPAGAVVDIEGGVPLEVEAQTILIEGTLTGDHRGGDRGFNGSSGSGPAPGLGGGGGGCGVAPSGGGGGGSAGDGGDGGGADALGGSGGLAVGGALLQAGPLGGGGGGGGPGCRASGGYGGFGGGSILLVADTIEFAGGTIRVDGAAGVVGAGSGPEGGAGGGGGAAGSITLVARRVTGEGDLSLVGQEGGAGVGDAAGGGGGGAGGRVVISGLAWDANITISNGGGAGGHDGQLVVIPAEPGEAGLRWTPSVRPVFPVCAGQVTLSGEGFTPGASVAVVTGAGLGHEPIPTGACAGVDSGLSGPLRLLYTVRSDAAGAVQGSQFVGQSECTRHVRLIDLTTCISTAVEHGP